MLGSLCCLTNPRPGWKKKETMDAWDDAEVCELIGIFMLFLLSQKYEKNENGLYRDDGLGVL